MRAIITPDDLKAGELAEVGWHPAEFSNYEETEASDDAKNPGSTNCNFYFKLIDPSPNKGLEVKKLINEHPKSLGFNKNLWATFNLPYSKEKGYEVSTELFKSKLGFKLMVYIRRGKSNKGNEFNDVVDFRPMS